MPAFTHIFSPFHAVTIAGAAARRYHPALSIWLSVDPMADKYPGVSPYAYCGNNPVRLVDPNGEEYILFGDEESKKDAITQIQNKTSMRVYTDKYGYLRVKGLALTKIDRFLKKSCSDESVQTHINCNNDNIFSWSDGSLRGTKLGGGYDGNYLWESCAVTRQCVSPRMLAEFDASVGDSKPGLTMIHELAESYYGGKIALKSGKGSPMSEAPGSTYLRAHWLAGRVAYGSREHRDDYNTVYDPLGNPIMDPTMPGEPLRTHDSYYVRVRGAKPKKN